MLLDMSNTVKREVLMVQAMNTCLLVVVATTALFDIDLARNWAFLIPTVWLCLLLVVPRLRKIDWLLKRFDGQLLPIARNSKWIGLWTGIWFAIHAALLIFSGATVSTGQIVTGLFGLLIFTILTAISNSWSYANLRWWKHISMLVWAAPSLGLGYVLSAPGGFFETVVLWTGLILYPLTIGFGLTGVFVKKPDYFARIRLINLGIGLLIATTAVLYL